jgi:hypothetical protein
MGNARDKGISLLLISNAAEKGAMLRREMERRGLNGEIRRMDPGRSAVAYARQSGPYKGSIPPDIVMIDFAEPDKRCLAMLKQVALSSVRACVPVVLLTRPETEDLLRTGNLKFDESRVFAPTTLACFVKKMREHPRGRFLRALGIMSDLGPILVRQPGSFVHQTSGEHALSA